MKLITREEHLRGFIESVFNTPALRYPETDWDKIRAIDLKAADAENQINTLIPMVSSKFNCAECLESVNIGILFETEFGAEPFLVCEFCLKSAVKKIEGKSQ